MELLFDDEWVDASTGVRRVLGRPQKLARPVLAPEQPWEGENIYGCMAVFRDPEVGRYRLYYRAKCQGGRQGAAQDPSVPSSEQPTSETRHFLCLAESDDGETWVRPDLGLLEFEASRKNNIVLEFPEGDSVYWNVVRDEEDPDPSRRYKAIGFDKSTRSLLPGAAAGRRGVCVDYSPDGLHWRHEPDLIMTTSDLTDSDCILAGREPTTGKWTGFFRPRTVPKRRFIGYSTSDDFEHWAYPRMLLTPDAADSEFTEFYGLTAVPVGRFRAGLLWIYHNNPEYSPMTVELAYSRDGLNYSRALPRTEFLPLGSDGSFDSRMISSVALLEQGPEHWIYYNGRNVEHGSDRGMEMQQDKTPDGGAYRCGVALAKLPWGHFCGLRAELDGVVETKYLCNYGDRGVRMLARCEADGWIRAEVLDQYGRIIPGWGPSNCRAVPGDDGWIDLSWGDGLTGMFGQTADGEAKVGHVVKLRFHLRKATLFGFDVGTEGDVPER